jgi:hypothetical protein
MRKLGSIILSTFKFGWSKVLRPVAKGVTRFGLRTVEAGASLVKKGYKGVVSASRRGVSWAKEHPWLAGSLGAGSLGVAAAYYYWPAEEEGSGRNYRSSTFAAKRRFSAGDTERLKKSVDQFHTLMTRGASTEQWRKVCQEMVLAWHLALLVEDDEVSEYLSSTNRIIGGCVRSGVVPETDAGSDYLSVALTNIKDNGASSSALQADVEAVLDLDSEKVPLTAISFYYD